MEYNESVLIIMILMLSGRIQARIDPRLQQEAEKIITQFGYTTSKLVTVIYSYIVKTKELPIRIEKIPNALTLQSMRNIEGKMKLKKFKNGKKALQSLGLI